MKALRTRVLRGELSESVPLTFGCLAETSPRVRQRAHVDVYRRANLLPRSLLHGAIADSVTASFLRGDFDTAVFQAFKAVEVGVRAAAGFGNEDIGVPLMRKAFDKSTGPLRDERTTDAEREAVAHLFAGAVGILKNPHSHRSVALTDSREAVEMIMLASHLLRIVDARTEGRAATAKKAR